MLSIRRSSIAIVLLVLVSALLGGCPTLTRGSHAAPAAEAGDGE